MERKLTCIVCPRGCELTVTKNEDDALQVTGNACQRGVQYAIDECTHPMRTLTTSARTENGGVIAVKTDRTIPKELLFDAMREVNKAVVKLPAHIGDIVIEKLLGTEANVIVTANMDK